VKTEKQDINLSQLFRQKLENAEVVPDAWVKPALMRRIAFREFIHFNPARFNLYYVAGILVTGISTVALLLSSPGNSGSPDNEPSALINTTDSSNFIEIQAGVPDRTMPAKSPEKSGKSLKVNTAPQIQSTAEIKNQNQKLTQQSNKTATDSISNALAHKGLVKEGATGGQKLQSGLDQGSVLIDMNALSGCAPFKLKFHNKSTSYDSCRWTFGDGGFSNEKDPEWIFDVEGEYKVVLQVFRNNGKSSYSSATVTVHPRPLARFEITPAKAVLPKDEIRFVNYSMNSVQFRWDFGDGSTADSFEPNHLYSRPGSFNVQLIAYSAWGCSDTLTVFNAFSGSEYFISFPNAFIANVQGPAGGYYSSKSDEASQVFHPSFSGVSDYHLKIFSKLGIPIFESNDINIGWDGYLKGQLCEPGVYIWKVRGKFRNGEPFIKMGDVTLLKK
jgi:PKD repeat protein